MANEHKGDFLDMFAEWAAAGARPAWEIVRDTFGPPPPDAYWNPNSLYQQKQRAEQEGRKLIPGALPPSAAIPGTGPTGNKVGVDYNPNEPGMQGGPLDRNVTQVTPGSRARDHEYIAQLQQHTPYWEREENAAINAATLANADRTDGTLRVTSDMEGYEDRADIQAWLAAASPEIRENFLANRARKAEAGLLKPNPNFIPAEVSAEDIAAHIADYGGDLPEKTALAYLNGRGIEWNTDMGEDEWPIPVAQPGAGLPQEGSNAEEVANQFARRRINNFLEAANKYGRN